MYQKNTQHIDFTAACIPAQKVKVHCKQHGKRLIKNPFNIILNKNDDQMPACNFTAEVILSCLNLLSIFCGAFYREKKM